MHALPNAGTYQPPPNHYNQPPSNIADFAVWGWHPVAVGMLRLSVSHVRMRSAHYQMGDDIEYRASRCLHVLIWQTAKLANKTSSDTSLPIEASARPRPCLVRRP